MNRLNLRTILILVILVTSLSVIYQNLRIQLILTGFTLFLLFSFRISKHKLHRLGHRLLSLFKLVLTILILQILFRRSGEIIWEYSFLMVTTEGLNYGLIASLRFLIIILVAGLLFDIPYYDYLLAFRSWKFPFEISFLVATIIHFVPIFNTQFKSSMEALQIRGIIMQNLPLLKRPVVYLNLLLPVLARAISEIKFRAISLELRGFRLYKDKTYLHEQKLSRLDLIIQFIALIFFLLLNLIKIIQL